MTISFHRTLDVRGPLLASFTRALASTLLVLLAVAWLDPALPWPPSTWTTEGLARVFLNAMPALAVLIVLAALTRRLWLAAWLVLVALWTLYAANAAKLTYLEMPLIPADLRMVIELGPSADLLGHYVRFNAAVVAGIAAVVAGSWLLYRAARPSPANGWRHALALVGVLAAFTLARGAAPWRWLYDADRLGFEPWSISNSAAHAGLIGSLLLYEWNLAGREIPDGDMATVRQLFEAHAPALGARFAASDDVLPDIVVVQSESFFDPSKLRGIAKGVHLRELDRLAKRAHAGELTVPTFGGGTIRTEFEVLTGAPLSSLDGVQYPWLELDASDVAGLPAELARHGYRTLAIHPNAGAFWNRARSYPALGFDRFIDGAAFGDDTIVGLFPGDAALTDRILSELDDDGPPQFIFAVSMEAHGPFDWRPGLDEARLASLPVPDALDEGGRYWLRNYLYLVEDADRALGRLADALSKRTRRTLLLFYGDHLPALPPVYAQLGFDDERAAEAQTVPWLLLDTASRSPHRLDTSAWLLPAILLDAAGVRGPSYFPALDVVRTELDLDRHPKESAESPAIVALARRGLRGEMAELADEVIAEASSALER